MAEHNPRIIHRIYFDNFAPFHDPYEHFLESWVREMPGYRIMKWNGSNLDVNENAWTKTAARAGAPVFLAEYFRWKVLSEYGGLYLDADCEILDGRVLDGLIEDLYQSPDYDTFFGVEERGNGHPTAQTVGARKGSELVAFMKGLYERNLAEFWPWREKRGLIGPQLMAVYFLNKGINLEDDGFFKNIDEPVVRDSIKIYPQTYFSPKFTILGTDIDYQEGKTCIYHMFANSNVDFSSKRRLKTARDRALTFSQYRESLVAQQQFPRLYDASWLSTNVGRHSDEGIVAAGVDGVVSYGPYVALPAGRYVARIHLSTPPRSGVIDITVQHSGGRQALSRRSVIVRDSDDMKIESAMFETDGANADIEFLIQIKGVDRIAIKAVEVMLAEVIAARPLPPSSLKILHRIYFGFDGKPDQFQMYLETWKQHLPGFKIMHWNASNLPMEANAYVRKLHAERDHAFLTDFFRWYVLREHGGVYLDADVEVVNGGLFDQLITELEQSSEYEALIGIDEKGGGWYTAHSMASKPQSDISRFMCDLYENFGSFVAWRKKGFYFWAPQLAALYFANRGHHTQGMGTTPHLMSPTVVAGVKIYPQEWFSPLAPGGSPSELFSLNALTENTALCHHFACSWHDTESVYLQHSQSVGGQANTLVRDIVERLRGVRVLPPAALSTAIGIKGVEGIRTSGEPGYLVYGPYITLGPGTHRIEFSIAEMHNLGQTSVDVVSDLGDKMVLAERVITEVHADAISFEMQLTETHHALEFRMRVDSEARFVVREVRAQLLSV